MRQPGFKNIFTALGLSICILTAGCGNSASNSETGDGSSDLSAASMAAVSSSEGISADSSEAVASSDIASSSAQKDGVTLTLGDEISSPDTFGWSGGSGRITIECSRISMDKESTLAELIFESSHYQYVKEGDDYYYGTHEDGKSIFVVPVTLNQNTTISALTTAMSQPHEIEYKIYVGKNDGSTKTTGISLNGQYDSLDEKAPDIPGLAAEESQPEQKSDYLRMYQYDQDTVLLEIDARGGKSASGSTSDNPSGSSASEDASSDSASSDSGDSSNGQKTSGSSSKRTIPALYDGNVVKYLIVPDDTELAAGLEKQAVLIRKPVEKIYLADSDAKDALQSLSLSGQVTSEGDENSAPDYKSLVQNKIDLVIQNADILSNTDANKITQNMVELDIPMLLIRSEDETSDSAKEAWNEVYRTIFS